MINNIFVLTKVNNIQTIMSNPTSIVVKLGLADVLVGVVTKEETRLITM